ncbi:hypothetical protein D3C72_898680 [compost metagenome]
MIVAFLQLIVGEAGAFTAKHQSDRVLHPFRYQLLARFAGIQHGPAQGAGSGTGADDQTAIGDGVIQRRDYAGIGQHIAGACRQGDGIVIWQGLRINQHQLRQPHGLHGSRRRPHVAGVRGVYQHDTNLIQHAQSIFSQKWRAIVT